MAWQGKADPMEEATEKWLALAFNTTPELVRQAVEDHYWMSLDNPDEPDPTKQTIWHEGE